MCRRLLKRLAIISVAVTLMFGSVITVYAEENASQNTEADSQETAIASDELIGDKYKCCYTHDPRRNIKAMEDIVVNPEAIYGFVPDKKSVRLGEYADIIDWTNPEQVEAARQDRINYLSQFESMYKKWNDMEAAGKKTETIAREVSKMRNDLRLASYKNDPDGLAILKKSNLDTYGNENGPTPEYLFEKYGSWDKVLMKCFSSNSGMDACLGLYEVQYDHNLKSGTIIEADSLTYTVQKGDNLSKIANRFYANKDAWINIYNANKNVIKNHNVVSVGMELVIPVS